MLCYTLSSGNLGRKAQGSPLRKVSKAVVGDMENTEHSGLLRALERGLSQALREDEDKDSWRADSLLRQDRGPSKDQGKRRRQA